jgi:hypothetical protein
MQWAALALWGSRVLQTVAVTQKTTEAAPLRIMQVFSYVVSYLVFFAVNYIHVDRCGAAIPGRVPALF